MGLLAAGEHRRQTVAGKGTLQEEGGEAGRRDCAAGTGRELGRTVKLAGRGSHRSAGSP